MHMIKHFGSIATDAQNGFDARELMKNLYTMGVKSLPIVAVTALFTGAIMVIQAATIVKRYGAEGLLVLRSKGATTFAQDEASCVVYGMPRAAWENGGAQRQLPLDRVAEAIVHHHAGPVPTHPAAAFPAAQPVFAP